jgi:hypothetical protein
MFLGFVGELIGALRDLLPSKEETNKTWLIKISALFGIFLIFSGCVFYILLNTTLGEKYNVKLIQREKPLTHLEVNTISIQNFYRIARLRADYPDIKSVMVVLFYDRSTGNMIQRAQYQNAGSMVWSWSLPLDKADSIGAFARGLDTILEPLAKTMTAQGCVSSKVPPDLMVYFRRAIAKFDFNHAVACPLFSQFQPGKPQHIVGYTLAFYMSPDNKDRMDIESAVRQINVDFGDTFSLLTPYIYFFY